MKKRYENRQPRYTHVYEIDIRKENDGTYSAYCLEHPPNPFDNDVRKCHLYQSGKICVKEGKEPRSFEVAEAFARYWMVGYSEYVRTGEFPDEGGSVRV